MRPFALAGRELIAELWDFVRNARAVRTASEFSTLLADYVRSGQKVDADDPSFASVHTYVMFVGVGRSGTTLVGALLDAHPRTVIARQQNTLKYLYPFSRQRIFRLLQKNSADQARRGWPGGGGYRYSVPESFQGTCGEIEVIGDKSRSAQAVEWLSGRPDLLARLSRATRCRIVMLHVIRNPFDTIARRSLVRQVSLRKISREYFSLTDRLQDVLRRLETEKVPGVIRVPVHLEDLINNPARELTAVCASLGIKPTRSWLENCSAIIHSRPKRARELVCWPPQLLEEIQQKIDDVPWLSRYSYEGS